MMDPAAQVRFTYPFASITIHSIIGKMMFEFQHPVSERRRRRFAGEALKRTIEVYAYYAI
jgi:hypothetical protein